MHYLGTKAARLKLKGIDGELVYSGGACGLIRLNAPNLTSMLMRIVFFLLKKAKIGPLA